MKRLSQSQPHQKFRVWNKSLSQVNKIVGLPEENPGINQEKMSERNMNLFDSWVSIIDENEEVSLDYIKILGWGYQWK